MRESAPLLLRPVHQWFFWWERLVPYICRVAAVGVAAVLTGALLWWLGVHGLLAAPVSLVVWIALAVVQEHDERIHLPVDPSFLELLRAKIDPVVAQHGFVFDVAAGPCRARNDHVDRFVYRQGDRFFWIHRRRASGGMQVVCDPNDLTDFLRRADREDLARRVSRPGDPAEDVDALDAAFAVVPATFWHDPFCG